MYIKYLSIPYKHLGSDFTGVDCLGLVRLFYKTELKIELPSIEYSEDWYNTNPEFMLESYSKFGFVKTDKVKDNCVVILKENGMYKHLGIVVKAPYILLHTNKSGTICEYKPSLALPSTYILEYRGTNDNQNR